MEKQLKHDCRSFDITKGMTIEEFNDKYNKILKQIKDKHGYITDVKIHAECGEYNDGENYYEEININYKRYETDKEFEDRKYRIQLSKENNNKYLREFIDKNKEEAIEYLKELGLI